MSEVVREEEFTEEETKNQMLAAEEDLIAGVLEAAGIGDDTKQKIEIVRGGKTLFAFSVRPLEDGEYDQCKTKNTKYVRNKHLGMKMPENTDSVKYRSSLIYTATVREDREKLWNNKKVWAELSKNGRIILTGTDVIDAVLFAGEKDRIINVIDQISGYDSNLEEIIKN